jgi:hypothetical protein
VLFRGTVLEIRTRCRARERWSFGEYDTVDGFDSAGRYDDGEMAEPVRAQVAVLLGAGMIIAGRCVGVSSDVNGRMRRCRRRIVHVRNGLQAAGEQRDHHEQ